MSAESGLSTFRDPDGVWAKYDYRDVATPEGFRANPGLVHEFYNTRRRDAAGVEPNAAHEALARLEHEYPAKLLIVTQNVDPLHERAGSRSLIHMHGELCQDFCTHCDARHPCGDDLSVETKCPNCGKAGGMRPDVVWFGEIPYEMDRIYASLIEADLFMSIGTSGNVWPAAGFVQVANEAGAQTVELNLEPSEGHSMFDVSVHGPATVVVPEFVEKLLNDTV